ncbi:lasso peptide biosynthesis protein [Pendulispora rubella]|uniref:Lasso peptide biosynthesis protein n=1 Tax=Pendulispora rubella TaxID=2741070 RepID=A0ABZ2LBL3_9BACT
MFRVRLLHGIARIAIRIAKPRGAKRITDVCGRLLPPFMSLDEACAAATSLDGTGTCLSRALTIAACLPASEVVIGVDPNANTALPLFAHAWVEVSTVPIRPTDAQGLEIARLGRMARTA